MNILMLNLLMEWLKIYIFIFPCWGVISGFSLMCAWSLRKTSFLGLMLLIGLLSLAVPEGLIFGLPAMTTALTGTPIIGLPISQFYWLLGGLIIPWVATFLLFRYAGSIWSKISTGLTKQFGQQRARRTDIRTVAETLPGSLDRPYLPVKYFNVKRGIFMGLDVMKHPVYLEWGNWCAAHVQIMGTTGSGKSVAAGGFLYQAILNGESVIAMDPKNDRHLQHVLAQAAAKKGVRYLFFDLQAELAQWNPFMNKSAMEIEDLLAAGLGLADKGTDADFYRIEDRRVSGQFAKFCVDRPGALHEHVTAFYVQHLNLVDVAKKFFADLEELATTPCVQAQQGFNLQQLLAEGVVIYVKGSTRNPRVLKIQRIFLLACMQAIEVRSLNDARSVSIFLDEFKYQLSRPALAALGTIRDKNAHVLIAHQSLGDLSDCDGDLNPEAVKGAVMENCSVRLVYRVQDPDTARWLAEKSGTILVDDEIREVKRNFGFTEMSSPERTLRQAERAYIDVNQWLSLPRRCAVLMGPDLAQFVYTSPIPVKPSATATATTAHGEESLPSPKGSCSTAEGLVVYVKLCKFLPGMREDFIRRPA